MSKLSITASLPYVNGAPHLGHALEYVQADVLARHARAQGRAVRLQSGTDDHALKNVRAAQTAGLETRDYIARQAARFVDLAETLNISFADYLHTSSDPRHAPAVRAFWNRLADAGDLYRGDYHGLYCTGCEQFYAVDELEPDGSCVEHGRTIEPVHERNWFFRLSRYESALVSAIESGSLRIEPAHRRNEVLAFVRAGLRDISVSRDAARACGWGLTVPGDPDQVIYVWLDALVNYISSLGAPGTVDFETWWNDPSAERVHVVGKGIVRFHAVYWCAFLLSAGYALPSTIFVHDYLTVDGAKIGKSLGNGIDPFTLVERFGVDALRWWLLREVPRVGDADFTEELLVAAANRDLANGFGNLVQRVTKLASTTSVPLAELVCARLADEGSVAEAVDAALARFDFRAALDAIFAVVDLANRHLEATAPWVIDDELDRAIAIAPALHAARLAARELAAFVPDLASRASLRLDRTTFGEPLFARLAPTSPSTR